MRDRARAVVIGGGVGGCSILYWLARLGWDDVVLVERAELTSGSTFHSAGLVGQLRSSLSLTKMMMASVDLYRSLEAEVGLETGWREVGSLRLASSEERMEEIARQAGWAKTFGLPLELISPADAQELFPPMSTDGVLGAAYLPDRRLRRPEPAHVRARRGRAAARRRGRDAHPGDRHRRRARSRDRRRDRPGVDRDRGGRQRRRHVRRGARRARRRHGADRADGPRVPRARAVRPAARDADDARPVAPRLLPPRVRRPDHGRLRAPLRAVGPRRDPAGLQRQAARRGLAAVRGADGERRRPRALARGDGRRQARQRPGGLHARTASSSSGRPTCAASGSQRGSARTGSPARAAWGSSSPSGSSTARRRSTSGTWTPGGSGRRTARATTRSRGRARSTRRTTTSSTRATSGRPGGPCASPRPTRGSASSAPCSARSRAGSAPTGSSRTPRGGDESLRPRGWAGKHWSPAIGAEHRACRETAAIFDESSFAKLDVTGEGAAAFLERLCANRVARDVGRVTYTQMLNERGGIECDFTVTRLARGPVPHRHRHRVRSARRRVDPPARAGRRLGARSSTSRRPTPVSASGGLRARSDPAAADHHVARERGVPVHDGPGARGRPGPVPRRARHVRRRARLGALLPGRVRRAALGRGLGSAGAEHGLVAGRLQGDRLAPPREGLSRVGRRHHPRGHALRGGPRLRGEARQGRPSSAARRSRSRSPSAGSGA